MTILVNKVTTRGIDHQAGAATLEMDKISVAYAAGSGTDITISGRVKNGVHYALQDITFEVSGGEQIAVVGPNGAGKSTLFKVIVGTIRPSRGTVQIYGHEPDCHICIAYVPQRSQIDWSFPVTVEDVVMMGRVGQIGLFRWPRKHDKEIVRRSLQRVGASNLAEKQIGELSGGQQQRVFIARAVAQGADLLLLDEPFSGLDIPSHDAILQILQSLHAEGVTLMVATHDINLASEKFDQVLLLNRKIIAYGPGPSILTAENLVAAYGGHTHVIGEEDESILLTDSCCDQGEEEVAGGW